MKKILFTMLTSFLFSALTSNAQKEEKIHLKIIKEKDGKVIEKIDTVYVSEGEGIFYFSEDCLDKYSDMDSIFGGYKVWTDKETRFIAISDENQSSDSILNMFWHVHGEEELDSFSTEIWHFYSDKDHSKIHHDNNLTWVMSDSVKVVHDIHSDDEGGIIVLKSGYGDEVEVLKKRLDKSIVWSIDSLGNLESSNNEGVFIYSTGTSTFNILKDTEGKHRIIKEVTIQKDGESEKTIEIMMGNVESGEKTIELLFDEDDYADSAKLDDLEKELMQVGDHVKIIRYKTDDNKIVIKAEITTEDSKSKETKSEKMNLKHGSEKGLFFIDLKLEEKVPTYIIVEDESGKTVYSKKLKKFDGKFSGEIDLTKEPDGKYKLQIIQDDRTVIKKMITK